MLHSDTQLMLDVTAVKPFARVPQYWYVPVERVHKLVSSLYLVSNSSSRHSTTNRTLKPTPCNLDNKHDTLTICLFVERLKEPS